MSTATRDMSSFKNYCLERFDARRFGPLTLLLALAAKGLTQDSVVFRQSLALDLLLLILLLVQFRLLDDLCDVPSDRLTHPHRVLCRAQSLRTFWIWLCALALCTLGLLVWFAPWLSICLYGALSLGLGLWYAARHRVPHLLTRRLIPLLKYPLFGLIAASLTRRPIHFARGFLISTLVFLAMAAYEILHDRRGL